jgi:biopolymer transport protein ExbB
MKKFFAILAIFGLISIGLPTVISAQPIEVGITESVAGGFHQAIKIKFIEGNAAFMSVLALCLILGLAFCLERVIYMSLADINQDVFLNKIGDALESGDVEGAMVMARDTRGPIASIVYQGLLRIDQGPDAVERTIISYGGVQSGLLEKNMSWITMFITIAPSIGFLGTVIGMVVAFDDIQRAGDMSPTIVAGGMKLALITTVAALIVALILQIVYNYVLNKMEGIVGKMEDASITFLDQVIKYNVKYKNL